MEADILGGIKFNFLKIASKEEVRWEIISKPKAKEVILSANPSWITLYDNNSSSKIKFNVPSVISTIGTHTYTVSKNQDGVSVY
jgi:hypothetical protein